MFEFYACKFCYYGIPRTITSVTEAVALLDLRLRSIVLAASIYPYMLNHRKVTPDKGELWRHSLRCLSFTLYREKWWHRFGRSVSRRTATDIGKIVLNENVRYGYSVINKMVEEKSSPFTYAEREVLGFDHAEIGGMIIDQWALPEIYSIVARYHHTPEQLPEEKQSYRAIVDIVHVANVMCLILGFGLGADGLQHNISEEALERLNKR